ncbi:MAG: glycosyltransferase family 39 protein [Candidatus Heimdallarchaeota archaeon]|nr:glycosyltransferase family 39 protein [Candidatus Heimdallarchaeota archaeon]
MAPVIIDQITNDLRDRYSAAASTINKEMIFNYAPLVLIIILAFLVRIFAMLRPFEIILAANDPFSQLKAAQFIETNGLEAFFSWVDPSTWYPEGRYWGQSQYIGTPLSAVLIHQFLLLLGIDVSLQLVAYLQPPLFGAMTCLVMYFLGKELGNKKVGLLAALFLSISAGHLQRTIVGFFDNEALGIFFLVLTLYFYARSLRTGSSIIAILSGISLGILSGSWGASTYVFNLLALHAFVLLLLRKDSDRLLLSYGGSVIIGSFIMTLIPRNGPSSLLSTDGLIPLGIVGLLVIATIYRNVSSLYSSSNFKSQIKRFYPLIGAGIVVALVILLLSGVLTNLSAKFITVIFPFFRDSTPILKSVSEHQLVVWAGFFRNNGLLIFFLPLGIYYLYEKPTERNLLLLIFGFTAIFFAGSMVRLALILAPAAALLSAKAIDQTLLPFVLTFQERFALSRRKTRLVQPMSNEHTAIAFSFIGLFLLFSVLTATQNAVITTQAPSILTVVPEGNTLIIGNDWQEAIGWLDYHTTINDVTASWWDYGYWISGNSNTTILVDNATINSTKIGNIGCMLVLNPRESLKIAKLYDVTYIVLLVSDGYGSYGLDSDLGKVPWFIRIGERSGNIIQIDQDDYLGFDSRGQYITGYIDKFYDSVFWSLFTAGVSEETYTSRIVQYSPVAENAPAIKGFSEEYAEYADYFELAYTTTHDWVYIWKINWDIIPPSAIAP